MSMTDGIHLSDQTVQFAYFDEILGRPTWEGKDVLDFGGNIGNLLRDPRSTIEPRRYWCVDIVREAIELGRSDFPEAHWIFYDRYNNAFNPDGARGLPIPPTPIRFDYILAYSVFTHTGRAEMEELVADLRGRLKPDGVLAFTFIDPHYTPSPSRGSNLRWRLERLVRAGGPLDVDALLHRASGARACTLLDRDLLLDDEPIDDARHERVRTNLMLYTPDSMASIFPDARIAPPPAEVYRPPARPSEFHHGCLLGPAPVSSRGG